jgi:hypothetical protein
MPICATASRLSPTVGGCDIVTEMFQSGELASVFAEQGIAHKAEA